MGRTEPSQGLAPPSFRRDARAKKAKATINKTIPALLSAHPRARRGVDSAELIVEPLNRKAQKSDTNTKRNGSANEQATHSPTIVLQVADTLTAAYALLHNETNGDVDYGNKEARVAILNMASPLSPGGGFTNGASSQEESLCMRTTLLASLKDEFYRLPELGAVYTPDVLVFRNADDEDLEKRERWFVDCVSAAMLRMPETEMDEDTGHGKYTNDKDRALILQKMRVILRILQDKGVKKVVLGAWGCGAYGNPVGEVARAWKKVLLPGKNKKETWEGIETIVFAITDHGLADGFERAFGDGLTRKEVETLDEEDEEEDSGTLAMIQLQNKIQEIELRIEQTQNDRIRAGLGSILADLRNQADTLEGGPEEAAGKIQSSSSEEATSEEEDD